MKTNKKWLALCTTDNGSTTFEYEVEALGYTDALIKCYLMLERVRPGFQQAHAVIELNEIIDVPSDK